MMTTYIKTMNLKNCISQFVFATSLCLFIIVQQAFGIDSPTATQAGLLILAHGAPGAKWNEPVNALVGRIRELNESKKYFRAVGGAFLEFVHPDSSDGIEKLEAAGCNHIIVVPLFIAPSSHSHFDVPAVLGLYSSPEILKTIQEEGARVATPKIPVTLTPTLSEGNLLDRFACEQVRALSKDAKNEAIVLLAHGCPDHFHLVESIMRRVVTYCCGQTGIDYGDWAYCEVGQSFWGEAAPAIARASEHKGRVLVVGLYVSSSAERIYQRASKSPHESESIKLLQGIDISYSNQGIVDYADTASSVLETAASALKEK